MVFATGPFVVGLLLSALSVAVVLLVTFAVARIVGKHSVIDTAWGALFAVIAIVTFLCSSGHGDAARRWLLLVLPVFWGGRLAIHIARRTVGKPEDPRYVELLAKAPGNPDLYALRMIYLLQGVLAFLISAPIQVGAYQSASLPPTAWIGVALWLLGVFFEGVGDAQMQRFRRDPANKGKLIQSGLWRYTRHPNYFGDACVWWGIFLVALGSWPVLLTIVCPIGMTLLLTKGSGARILERHMSKRAGWDDYAARTSGFIPLPPRKKSATT
ncbi:steroid 5-alpha reductase family enzyme [Jatrophihabitans sp. GAS493]|uniref:DUF1295 domain-containing protein n=1 Tax=Jatrophihabitans sp. GAS493 TaxID=1907575 RepID=UPI000BB74257|nr:DUF1295 domain-containing protein [Jatrophihabitans sp. GAS493]SOD73957.1 steroid 5-alpha reductase family enzyme [Jatrophihabitans sp. GAS493]